MNISEIHAQNTGNPLGKVEEPKKVAKPVASQKKGDKPEAAAK